MTNLITKLANDERGFIVSAELVLVSTIAVLGLIVGLSELSHNVNQELEDLGSAVGSINQSYEYSGAAGHKGHVKGSYFDDQADHCDGQFDVHCEFAPRAEY